MNPVMEAAIRKAAIKQGRIERARQSLPEKLIDPVAIGKLAVLWGGEPDGGGPNK
jgi:hypothetical protein